jgi:hypothetical protein
MLDTYLYQMFMLFLLARILAAKCHISSSSP